MKYLNEENKKSFFPRFKKEDEPDKPSGKNDDDDNFKWKKASKTSLMWVIIIISTLILLQILRFDQGNEVPISFYQYKEFLAEELIRDAIIIENEFHGELITARNIDVNGRTVPVENFVVTLPSADYIDSEVLKTWDDKGIRYTFKEKSIDWFGYLMNLFPWVLLIFVWIFIMRRMQAGSGRGIFNFGKSRARIWTSNRPKVTFKDVAGCDEAKTELHEIIEFLKEPEKFQRLGGRIPKGALLTGPPGTGKTLLAQAIAGEAGVPFFSISGADFVEMFVGVGASRVRDLFEQGKKHSPCIIFIDEMDAVGRHRGAGLGGGHDEREQTLNQLLVEMDGFDQRVNVILIAATNRPDVLDSALLRPGRFDRQIVVDVPDVRGREGILQVHTRKIPLSDDVDLGVLAKSTPGMVGADLENLVNEAALLASRRDKNKVEMEDFEEAKDKVMMGVERKSMLISKEERKLTAYHEAGHALIAYNVPEADPIHKVTIIPRGRALGVTHQLPMDERHNYSKKYIEAQLSILLGGRIAEELIFQDYSTGAGNDLERVTEIARKMVCEWGMSTKLGPLTFGKKQEEIFLGREIAQHRDYSEETAQVIDSEVKAIIDNAYKRSEKILTENLNKLHRFAETLLEKEVLSGDEIESVLEGKKFPRKKRKKSTTTKKKTSRSSKTGSKAAGSKQKKKTSGKSTPGKNKDAGADNPDTQ